MRRKFFLLLGWVFCTYLSTVLFPTVDSFSLSNYLSALIFNPFNLLGAVVCFICGFLAFASLIKEFLEKVIITTGKHIRLRQIYLHRSEKIVMLSIILCLCLLLFIHVWVTLASLIMAMYYSIMDIKDKQEEQSYFDEL
ncbi:hypothetical protein ACJ2A9_10400 [Anaerobacillus sp. MEB173]|uniref:hypothetical protein n=1 Tax=Anaerobacillus sp. MEB173 TaxID=3383345 RepID=UPI003F8DE13F